MYYPFADEGEWSLAKFLVLNMNKTQVSEYLKLPWVCCIYTECVGRSPTSYEQFETRPKQSFQNMDQMYAWLRPFQKEYIGSLQRLTYRFEMLQDANLIWHDGLEFIRDLFSNLMCIKYMTYNPHTDMCGTECEYSEFFTGACAHTIQVSSQDADSIG